MLHRASRLLCVLACVAGVVVSTAPASAGADPTFYWTYTDETPPNQSATVDIQDQFFASPTHVTAARLGRVVNWVILDGAPPVDFNAYYSWWDLKTRLPIQATVKVTNVYANVSNGYDAVPVQLSSLDFLLVPAWQNNPQPSPRPANQYACYKASQGIVVSPTSHHGQDQWQSSTINLQPLEYICVPCMMDDAGTNYPILDPATFLAAYAIAPQSARTFTPSVQDPFFQGTVLVGSPAGTGQYLFVPSTVEQIPTASQNATWGRVKSLYR